MPLADRRRLLHATAASGDIPNLAYALEVTGLLATAEEVAAAAAAGQLEACKWLCERCRAEGQAQLAEAAVGAAAGAGKLEVVEWFIQQAGPDWKRGPLRSLLRTAMTEAFRGGHSALAEALEAGRPWGPAPEAYLSCSDALQLAAAAAHGLPYAAFVEAWTAACNVVTAHRIAPQPPGEPATWSLQEPLAAAAGSPTPDWTAKVDFLLARGCRRRSSVVAVAVAAPDGMERLLWLTRQRGFPVEEQVLVAAAGRGNLGAVQRLLTAGVRPLCTAAEAAAEAGHVLVIHELWAAGGIAVLERVAAHAGTHAVHPDTLRWLHRTAPSRQARSSPGSARGGAGAGGSGGGGGGAGGGDGLGPEPYAEQRPRIFVAWPAVLAATAAHGDRELVEWLAAARGYAWGPRALEWAAGSGCQELVEWMVEAGCPLEPDAYVAAGRNGDLAMLSCLRRLGCPWTAATFTHAVIDHRASALGLDTSCAARTTGHGAGGASCRTANARTATCPLPVLKWMVERGCPVEYESALAAAMQLEMPADEEDMGAAGSESVVQWLEAQPWLGPGRGSGGVVLEPLWWLAAKRVRNAAARALRELRAALPL
ncbi:hypothetical protein HYH03_009729 [Edaphochlamys debaryana]|uniref:Ankyrin repeat domain-containing protein n=1 Tax=Edaphochlamys debaryana TaxID=47281 RepID=A0A835XY96_9CHLO|nr:hypothetical protein HYH03_009729 [Edaphochlamys debaryana]|eukprot:KAG2491999.1 hypothetical protein HYH03_009729 [Edaphochlamys debaryana]